jgi:hypothetical protein
MAEIEKITVTFSEDEALVLFDFLSRFNQTEHKDIFQDQAEQKVMWLIEGQLEKILVEPFMPNYNEIIKEARDKIRDDQFE